MSPKEIIRCPACGCNQFMTNSGNCRKCKTPLDEVADANPFHTEQPKSDLGNVLVNNIILARKSRGWSQRHLANRMGVSQQAVSLLETNDCDPQLRTLQRLAEALSVPAYALLVPPKEKQP